MTDCSQPLNVLWQENCKQVFMFVKAKIIVIESIQTILRRDNDQLENKGFCYIVTSQVQLSL